MNRRTLVFGGTGAALLAGLGWRTYDRGVFTAGKGAAYDGWTHWQGRSSEAPTIRALHAALLASSAHNSQPWQFTPQPDGVMIAADPARNLGAADPFRRELCTSLGCAWAMLYIALPEYSFDLTEPLQDIRLLLGPDMPAIPSLKLSIFKSGRPKNLYVRQILDARRAAIPRRHTHRGPYLPDRSLPHFPFVFYETEGGINTVLVTDPAAKRDLGALIIAATERFIADPAMSADSAKWFRTGRSDIARHRDGITADTAGLSPLMTGLGKLLPDADAATADGFWLDLTRDVQIPTAAAFGVIFCRNRLDSTQAMLTGATWQKAHLDFTAQGIVAQPLNQPIEIMDRDHLLGRPNEYAKAIRKICGVPSGDPAFIFRLGHAARPAQLSPRRAFDDVVKIKRFA